MKGRYIPPPSQRGRTPCVQKEGNPNLKKIIESRLACVCLVLACSPLLMAQSSGSYIITTVAGLNGPGFSGDGGPALYAGLSSPAGIAVDNSGNVFIADTVNYRVRRVSPQGVITTVAGNGTNGFGGDGGSATSAQLSFIYAGNYTSGVAVDADGNLFIADSANNRVRRVTPQGIITTVAGDGSGGFGGDGGQATSAQLSYPSAIAADASGNLFISDYYNDRIRKVTPQGIISTVAGDGTRGFGGDGGPATSAALYAPLGLALDPSGNLFIADMGNNRIRKVTPQGAISTVVGNGTWGFSGDGGPAISAELERIYGVAVDKFGNILVPDWSNDRIREVALDGTISTVAGGNGSGLGSGGPATSDELFYPWAITIDTTGNLFIAGSGGGVIRELIPSPTSTAGCVYSVDPSYRSFDAIGGTNNVSVLTSGSGCYWLAISYADWITATPTGLQSGIGLVNYTVNPNMNPVARSGTVWIAGNSMNIDQAAIVCSDTVSPLNIVVPPTGAVGAILAVTAPSPNCGWNAGANVPWILVGSGNTGAGSTNVTYTVGINTGGWRTGTLTVAGQTVSVTQGAASCEVTGDMQAGVADVQFITNEALGGIAAADDLNLDGAVNVADVQIVINAVLGSNCTFR